MKKPLTTLVLCFVIAGSLFAQNYYTVQVGSFLDVRPQDFDPIRPLGLVYANQVDGNLYDVYLGGYTSQDKANSMVNTLKGYGFNSAQAIAVDITNGQEVTVIQMATRYAGKTMDWDKLVRAGTIYAIVDNERIKIVAGIFSDIPNAKEVLPSIRSLGYDDAFIKQVNSAQLIPITPFTTGIKQPLIPLNISSETPPPAAEPVSRPVVPESRPVAMDNSNERITTTTPRTPRVPRPADREETTTTRGVVVPPGETPPSYGRVEPVRVERNLELPAIRSRIKRRSALELQKVLKAEGYYTSTLDGYYGPGTTGAYEEAMANDATLKKYQWLAENMPIANTTGAANRLQQAINELYTDPNASLVIEASQEPIARAYQAYLLFTTLGPANEVNTLMNQSIRAAYDGKPLTQRPPFDYRATYAYQDLDQLIQHLHYIHAAPDIDYSVPCWLSKRHPEETSRARAAMVGFTSHLNLSACDPFLQWPEVQLLEAVANETTPAAQLSQEKLNEATTTRSRLYLSDTPLTASETTMVESWNQKLWDGLNQWAAADPLHANIVKALKVSYFQTQVRLEDYYMDQGFKADEAKGLALATIQTLVGLHLQRFAR